MPLASNIWFWIAIALVAVVIVLLARRSANRHSSLESLDLIEKRLSEIGLLDILRPMLRAYRSPDKLASLRERLIDLFENMNSDNEFFTKVMMPILQSKLGDLIRAKTADVQDLVERSTSGEWVLMPGEKQTKVLKDAKTKLIEVDKDPTQLRERTMTTIRENRPAKPSVADVAANIDSDPDIDNEELIAALNKRSS